MSTKAEDIRWSSYFDTKEDMKLPGGDVSKLIDLIQTIAPIIDGVCILVISSIPRRKSRSSYHFDPWRRI
jgi:hypothetical protein